MGYEQILYEIRDGVAIITLNRPEVLKAWTPQMGREMGEVLEESKNK
jgi:enoyl-CoA hydratase/carnithine racemase